MTLDGERAFIFHPDPPEGFLEKLKACSGLDVSMELVDENNMGDLSADDFGRTISEHIIKEGYDLEKISFSSAYLSISIDEDESAALQLARILLQNVPFLQRGEVEYDNGIHTFRRGESPSFREHSVRLQPITDEDLLDLKILLYGENMDVLQFLEYF